MTMARTWTDLSLIEQPERIARLARDVRGYPIPFVAEFDDQGNPDFRALDMKKWTHAVNTKRCGICGQPLGGRMAFVGGPLSMANRLFTDLPMHRTCAEYALRVCPFIAAPKFAYSPKVEGVRVATSVSDTRPERFGLGISRGFSVAQLPSGDIVLHAKPFEEITWWREGRQEGEPEK
jgi:hypothetical protein